MPIVRMIQPNAEVIRALRLRRGLSANALGAKIGRHERTIYNIETQGRRASELLINQIANGLGVDVNELIKPAEDAEDTPSAERPAA